MSLLDKPIHENGISLFSEFVAYHKPQLELSGVPIHFWEILCKKLNDQIFDAGQTFSIQQLEYEERVKHQPLYKVQTLHDVDKSDPQHIYLIDHAWTYRMEAARRHLREIPGLQERMTSLMGLADLGLSREDLVDHIFDEMWKYNQTYTLNGLSVDIEDRMPVWYIMDEFGSAIQHSDEPSFRTVPLVHLPAQVTYTLLFPIKDLSSNNEVTRDYVEGYIESADARRALLLPWQPHSFLSQDFLVNEPDDSYFLEGHVKETLPTVTEVEPGPVDDDTILKVYADYRYINEYLTHPRFEMVADDSEADVLWFMSHFKQYQELSEQCPKKFVNQFPFENVLTIKDLLCIVSRRNVGDDRYDADTLDTYPAWLPTTFNLKTELTQFVSYYQRRDAMGLDNHWIVKPWNLARGLDTHITSNLDYILKLFFSGPKIVQKYIERPLLFQRPGIGGVKFDLRYVVLLRSVRPLRVYAYRNFFLRFANHAYQLADFDDYEKHFTVMNYQQDVALCRVLCRDFVEEFHRQNPDESWSAVERSIFSMLHDVFVSASSQPAPRGIVHSPQSRALYAADIMLDWSRDREGRPTLQPKLLEINYTPDCKRACEYYPDFFNQIFALLFLDQLDDQVFQKLG